MKIGLLGFGTVGSGIYEIISQNKNFQEKEIVISKILIRNKNKIKLNQMTINPDDIFEDDNIDLIVEVMGGIQPAYEYILKSLNSGKHVVTANKAVVSKYLNEFTEAAKRNNVAFLYEASVCGGIPWLDSLKRVKRIDEISEVSGIFNGTSNFILYNMYDKSYDFNDILTIAQKKGYAEADPSADIDGIDIQRKLAITSSIAFQSIVDEENIPTHGIRNITKSDINYFKEKKLILKLLALTIKRKNEYCSSVEPVLFKNNTIEANINDNFNIGTLVGETIGVLKFYGQGAGKLPTGNAIVQDILDIYTKKDLINCSNFERKLICNPQLIKGKYYVRYTNKKVTELLLDILENTFKISSAQGGITKEITLEKAQNIFNKIKSIDNKFFFARFS
ncbi:homoserine dehydrogenase [Sedimentibacter sp. MB31-C6]|uniref:homoserine dehydrogenase n=1 Tax=Sedimentibacter sp. MB31-C6 TaxID=3109366 RepID=UPI002DDD26FE|nr:homoserine dehydrogenase [Sedimentibacter sp. MB36-C1]WSI03826.1 homoserine dehydrogenase [Sedimentibacter sp. MB36-C1]